MDTKHFERKGQWDALNKLLMVIAGAALGNLLFADKGHAIVWKIIGDVFVFGVSAVALLYVIKQQAALEAKEQHEDD